MKVSSLAVVVVVLLLLLLICAAALPVGTLERYTLTFGEVFSVLAPPLVAECAGVDRSGSDLWKRFAVFGFQGAGPCVRACYLLTVFMIPHMAPYCKEIFTGMHEIHRKIYGNY